MDVRKALKVDHSTTGLAGAEREEKLEITVTVSFDAVASRDANGCVAALETLSRAGALITRGESVVFDRLNGASHPHFWAISAKVKSLPLTS